ncbi:tetratricopeptide repeat protein [Mastigocladus laminosus UU774]|nr:tetratricopeptide repeat protein [Mastigocladus laminosus UU774]
MTEANNPDNPDNINLDATAHEQSRLTQVGNIQANIVHFGAPDPKLLEKLESINPAQSAGVLKAGNPCKSLAYWQGRTTEIAQLQQWLNDPNVALIGIEGIGGTGKSMLAAKIYEEIAGFPKRFWADVGSGAVFSEFARRILSDFDCPIPEQESQFIEALVKCLQSGQYLLIIDNLESLLQPDRQWASQLYGEFFNYCLEYRHNSTVVVTTRERPQEGKFTWLPLSGLKVEEGTALLTALGIGGDLENFVKLVDGHPLLLRLVADLIKEEYPQHPNLEHLADLGLGNLQQLLTNPKVVGLHRRENVGMVLVLDASFERLSDLQKTLLLNVSVYRGAFDQVAAAVFATDGQVDVETELRNLVKRSFLLETFNNQRKYQFQPVVLEYVRYKAGDQTAAHQQAIAHYRSIAKEEHWQTIDDVRAYLEIFYHFYQLADYDSAFDAVWTCNDFLTLRGYYTIQVDVYGQLIAAWEKIGDRENWNYGASLTSLGNAYHSLGEDQRAIDFHQQSLDITTQIGDRSEQANSLNNLGNAYYSLGKYQRAINFYQQSLDITTQIGDRSGQATPLNNLGNAYNCLGEYQRAINFYQQSLDIDTQIGDRSGQANCLIGLGITYDCLGEYQRAIDFYQQSLDIDTQIGDVSGQASCLIRLGNAYDCLGEYQRAINFLQQSLDITTQIGDVSGQANSWFNLGLVLEKVNRQSDAMGAYRNACELYQAMGLDADVQDCNNAINRLSHPLAPVVASLRGFWGWLSRLWRWVRSWLRR